MNAIVRYIPELEKQVMLMGLHENPLLVRAELKEVSIKNDQNLQNHILLILLQNCQTQQN